MTSQCPTSLTLAQFSVEGDLIPGASGLKAHTAQCRRCAEALVDLEADRKAFLVKHPFSAFWNDLEARKAAPEPIFKRLFRWLNESSALRAAVAMAGLAGIMVVSIGRETPTPQILTKGGVDLQFYVASPQGSELGKSGMKLPEGSGLQFVYTASEPYLLLVGVEEDRSVSLYYPSAGTESSSIESGNRKKLPQALRWQPKTSYERFYGIFSKQPVKFEEIKKAINDLAGKKIEDAEKLPLPYPQTSTLIYRSAR